jgi:pyroglutamyl-peptidase
MHVVNASARSQVAFCAMQVLLTGFEPFGGSDVNPSALVASQLAQEQWPGMSVVFRLLPVVTGTESGSARSVLAGAIAEVRPEVVICFGESARAAHVTFERVAVNLRDGPTDNAGVRCVDMAVDEGGPAAHFATLPVRRMANACESEGVPAVLSTSAGTFLCNEVLYALLDGAANRRWDFVRAAGFIHVPQLPEQARVRGGPSMPLEHMVRGVRASVFCLGIPFG